MSIRRPSLFASAIVPLLLFSPGAHGADTAPSPPVAGVKPVETKYFGTKVTDPYRWFEDDHSPEFVSWLKGQAQYADHTLAQIPGRDALRQRVQELSNSSASIPDVELAGKKYFYQKTAPGDDTRKLYVRGADPGSPERLLVDPATLGPADQHFALDYYTASPDGSKVAYAVSAGGNQDSTLRVLDVDTGKDLGDAIDRTGIANPNWSADSTGFYYTRFRKPEPGQSPSDKYLDSAACFHLLGSDPEKDRVVFSRRVNASPGMVAADVPFIAVSPVSRFAIGWIAHGISNEETLYVAPIAALDGGKTPWKKLADVPDAVTYFDFRGDTLYLLTHRDASKFKVLQVDMNEPDLAKARVVIPPGDTVITHVGVAMDALYVQTLDGGLSRLARIPFEGAEAGKMRPLPLPFEGAVNAMAADPLAPGIAFTLEGWVHSEAILAYDPAAAKTSDTGLAPPSPVDFSAYESREFKIQSDDGVQIPLSLIAKKNQPFKGDSPVLLAAYGASGANLYPTFTPQTLAWLERGGIIAVAHVRGGGELGEDWHLAGQKLHKENSVWDFITAGQWLVDKKYTSPARLGAKGTGAGGIVVGGALTRRPDLFAAIISEAGWFNMLRAEFSPTGPANIPEFGTVKEPDGFKALAAVDACQAVKDGVAYPAVLLTTGVNDPRVPVWQPAKLAARLQAASRGGKPVLLRVEDGAGNGGATKSQVAAKTADEYAFLLWQFGLPDFQPPR